MEKRNVKYTFKEFGKGPPPFRGMSVEEFQLICRYLDDITPTGFRKAVGFIVVASFSTKVGVIDCFVN